MKVIEELASSINIPHSSALNLIVEGYRKQNYQLEIRIGKTFGSDPPEPMLFDGEPGITVRDPGPVCLRFLNFMVKQALARKDSAEYKPLGWLIEILNANLDRMTTKDGTTYAPLTLPTYEEFTKPKPQAAPLPVRYEGLATASKSPTKTLDADWLENLDLDAEFGKM